MFSPQGQLLWLNFLCALQSVCALPLGFLLLSSSWEQSKTAACMSWWVGDICSPSAAGRCTPWPACQPLCPRQIPPLWPGWAPPSRPLRRSSGSASCAHTRASAGREGPGRHPGHQEDEPVCPATWSVWAGTRFFESLCWNPPGSPYSEHAGSCSGCGGSWKAWRSARRLRAIWTSSWVSFWALVGHLVSPLCPRGSCPHWSRFPRPTSRTAWYPRTSWRTGSGWKTWSPSRKRRRWRCGDPLCFPPLRPPRPRWCHCYHPRIFLFWWNSLEASPARAHIREWDLENLHECSEKNHQWTVKDGPLLLKPAQPPE